MLGGGEHDLVVAAEPEACATRLKLSVALRVNTISGGDAPMSGATAAPARSYASVDDFAERVHAAMHVGAQLACSTG